MDRAKTARIQAAKPEDEAPWEPEIAADGVDLGLIRSMLQLTPTQRLARLQDFVAGVLALRRGRQDD